MAITRPFAYNPSQIPISGTTQTGNIAIGVTEQDYASGPGGVNWYMGPDETDRFILCHTGHTVGATPIGFFGTIEQTNQSFIDMVNVISRQQYTGVTESLTWCESNGIYTTYTPPPETLVLNSAVSGDYKGYYTGFIGTLTPDTFAGETILYLYGQIGGQRMDTVFANPISTNRLTFEFEGLGTYDYYAGDYTNFYSPESGIAVWMQNNAGVDKNVTITAATMPSVTNSLTIGAYYGIRNPGYYSGSYGALSPGTIESITINYMIVSGSYIKIQFDGGSPPFLIDIWFEGFGLRRFQDIGVEHWCYDPGGVVTFFQNNIGETIDIITFNRD